MQIILCSFHCFCIYFIPSRYNYLQEKITNVSTVLLFTLEDKLLMCCTHIASFAVSIYFYLLQNNFKFSVFDSYQLLSGYKPAPMDLSFIKLTPSQEAMVDKLAENAHNVWARDRIRQGWTYGIQQVSAIFSYLKNHLSIEIFYC